MMIREKETRLVSGSVRYRVGGNGPPLLYLHGIGGAELSRPLKALTSDYRVYAPVVPGFNGTAMHDGIASMPALADLVAGFAEAEIGAATRVIAHSFGGLLAMWFALRHPARVVKLILVAPAGIVAGEPPAPGTSPAAMHRRLYAHPERVTLEERSSSAIRANQGAGGRYYALGFMAEQLIANLEMIDCPTLILAGACDGIVPRETGQLLKARLPRSELVTIADAAHRIEADQPALYESSVRHFLADRTDNL